MKALCYAPYSYSHICKHGIIYVDCDIIDGIAYFHEVNPFYCKTVNEIKDGKEIYPYQKELDKFNERN